MVPPPAPSNLACLVLAGGRASRFGSEKPLALLHARTLLEWTASRLGELGAPLAVSARRESETEKASEKSGWPVLHDAETIPRGPLDGICAGLAWAHVIGRSWLVVLPCDVPLLPDDYFPRLLAAAGSQGAYAWGAGGHEPLCAIWPTNALTFVQTAAQNQVQPSIHQCLKDIGASAVRFDMPFINANRKDELAEIERMTRVEGGKLVRR